MSAIEPSLVLPLQGQGSSHAGVCLLSHGWRWAVGLLGLEMEMSEVAGAVCEVPDEKDKVKKMKE